MAAITNTLPAKRRQEHECSASCGSIRSVKRHEQESIIDRLPGNQQQQDTGYSRLPGGQQPPARVSGSWPPIANGTPTGWLLSRIRCLQNSDKNMRAVQGVGELDQSKDMNKSQLQTGYQEISISNQISQKT
ncbi:hypothetical protein LSTR_LSTR012675 [Laodelphax striatellus]|uniref:Uncharacterized protein n=1 Tax=Laodelphax striatellus TaxID=195883 RepID=A0A482XJA0_LAOST|nr:hypothetical protein LSTR_LSTR012675 [Laodelphax striatellus]